MNFSQQRPSASLGAMRRLGQEQGVEALEVALIGVLVIIVLLAAIPLLGEGIGTAFADVTSAIENAGAGID
jgi:Flp pilus assembly pilin Flp